MFRTRQRTNGHTPSRSPRRYRSVGLTALVLLAAPLAACAGSPAAAPATSAAGGEPAAETSAPPTDEPLVRLTSMTYQGLPSYEFRYGPDGEPLGHTVFHPVTGEPRVAYTVDEVDSEGRPVAFTVEYLEKGSTGDASATYDDAGRLVAQSYSDGINSEATTTYTWAGDIVTMKNPTTTTVYTLDADGNILTNDSAFSGTTSLLTNLEFDDSPNPFTLTGGQMVQIISTNNAIRWAPDAGCEYVEDFTYDGDLLVASHAEGCGFTHDYTYEYAEF